GGWEGLAGRAAALQVLAPRGWFVAALLGLAPAFLAGPSSTAALAVAIGGVLLAYRAFGSLVQGLEKLGSAAIAWERVQLFWRAAARREPIGQPELATVPRAVPASIAGPERHVPPVPPGARAPLVPRDPFSLHLSP